MPFVTKFSTLKIALHWLIERTWNRCYDHNFLRFSTIFGEKIGVFPKNQCYDHNFFKN
jgi:hypothetical protein